MLTAAQQMMALAKPAEADRQSVGRYLWNRKSLVQKEGSWIEHRDDLITLRAGREHAWLDGVVENVLKICHCRIIDALFRSSVSNDFHLTISRGPNSSIRRLERKLRLIQRTCQLCHPEMRTCMRSTTLPLELPTLQTQS